MKIDRYEIDIYEKRQKIDSYKNRQIEKYKNRLIDRWV